MTKATVRRPSTRSWPASLHGFVAVILIFGAAQQSIAAGAKPGLQQPDEKRLHYLFLPNPRIGGAERQPVRATAIVRGERELKLILDFGDGSSLVYVAQSDRDRCTSHERMDFSAASSDPLTLVVDGPRADCPGVAARMPRVSLAAGSKTLAIDGESWKSRGLDAAAGDLGPDLARVLAGPIATLSKVNPFIRILCARVAPLLVGGQEKPSGTNGPYIVRRTLDGCSFDTRHSEPCEDIPPTSP